MTIWRGVAVVIFLLVSVLLLNAGSSAWDAQRIGKDARNFQEIQDRFVALAKEKGAEHAFEVLRAASLPPQTDLHLLGHTVGDELYRQKGVEGIALCSQDFRNACSHSIVIGALEEYGGEAALPRIREACETAPGRSGAYTMCYHGLGHGVFAFFDYDLPATVDFCKKTGTDGHGQQEYTECVGGAIMELVGGGGHDRSAWMKARVRYFSANDALAPCMSDLLPDPTKTLCLIYLTPRLLEVAGARLGAPDPAFFGTASSYCEAIPQERQDWRDACFGGFGKEFVPLAGKRDIRKVDRFSDDEFRTAISWCGLIVAADGRDACIADAVASIFWGGENDPEASFRFCALVSDQMRGACYMRLSKDIRSYGGGRTRKLCDRLPVEYRASCSV
ncbi:MAG: hypothetical protein HYS26_04525 [Candidatus Kaiserbacteria bacterium]|nr:MAG: hypothetical protein HYS26_04525 [Candidatus Kaiserbacteria bacterium]